MPSRFAGKVTGTNDKTNQAVTTITMGGDLTVAIVDAPPKSLARYNGQNQCRRMCRVMKDGIGSWHRFSSGRSVLAGV